MVRDIINSHKLLERKAIAFNIIGHFLRVHCLHRRVLKRIKNTIYSITFVKNGKELRTVKGNL